MNIPNDTRLIDLTVGQLRELIAESQPKKETQNAPDEYAYGIDGLAKTLGCGRSYAFYVKKSGIYKEAIQQQGRKIIVNVTLLRTLIPHA